MGNPKLEAQGMPGAVNRRPRELKLREWKAQRVEGTVGESPERGSLIVFAPSKLLSSNCRSSECRPRELVAERVGR